MKTYVYKAVEVEIKPGDKVIMIKSNPEERRVVTKVVETYAGVYVVFDDNTWRPMSSYGVSWEKVEE